MDKKFSLVVFEFLKGELRTILALTLLLLIFVGLGLAADTGATFDFGTGLSSEVAPGAISVAGGASVYPQTAGDLTFGWTTPYVAEQSSGAQVADPIETDSNQGVGDNTFKISGLSSSYYLVTLISGNLTNAITTKVVVGGAAYIANSNPGQWKTLTFKAATQSGTLEFNFKRYGTNLWAVNAIILAPTSAPPAELTFDVSVQPTEHLVQAGGTVLYRVSILPNNGYSSEVGLAVSGLPSDMQSAVHPASGFPPFSANLEVTTSQTASITRYDFTLTAKGNDTAAYTVNKNLAVMLTTDAVPINSDANIPVIEMPPIDLKAFKEQAADNQAFIDSYISAEQRHLLSPEELDYLQNLPSETSFAVMPNLPLPRSLVDASLRQLTGAGIIGMVVDSAPVAESAPPAKSGFWAQFLGSMFNPAQ